MEKRFKFLVDIDISYIYIFLVRMEFEACFKAYHPFELVQLAGAVPIVAAVVAFRRESTP